jgi:hypothetical protein
MPYSQYTLDSLAIQLGVLLDDPVESYWTRPEKYYAIWEALRVWGALTSNWRSRGVFSIGPSSAWYDLSAALPTLRTRSWTLNQIVTQIQYMILENPSGIAGTGMSGQIDIGSILDAVKRARNDFIIDAGFPFTIHPAVDFAVISPDGLIQLPNTISLLHRLSFLDSTSGSYTNLWREDAWAADHNNRNWTVEPATPTCFSQSESSPLTVQLIPSPINAGSLEAVTVDTLEIDTSNPNATFGIPDEWIHAILYGALADLFSAGQMDDFTRFQYCNTRYEQAIDAAKMAKSVIRLQLNGTPLPIDSLASIDAGMPYWRNQAGRPQMAGVLYDLVAFAGIPDGTYGVMADVVQSAPIPTSGSDPVPLGTEDIPEIINYCVTLLTLKCGGNEFSETLSGYDSFLKSAVDKNNVLAVKARYMKPIFGQPEAEMANRPDRMRGKKNAT